MSMWTHSRHVLCLCFKLLADLLFDRTEGSTVIGFQGLRSEMKQPSIFRSTLQYKQTHGVPHELCWSQSWNLLDTVILADIACALSAQGIWGKPIIKYTVKAKD